MDPRPILIGFAVSIIGGWIFVGLLRRLIDRIMTVDPDEGEAGLSPSVVGVIERAFFTLVVAADLPGTLVGMIA